MRYLQVFNTGSLAWKIAAALAMLRLGLGVLRRRTPRPLSRRRERLYLLSNEPWPRSAKIEVVGIEVLRSAAPGEEAPRTITIPFERQRRQGRQGLERVAQGASGPGARRRRSCRSNAPSITARSKSGAGVRGERGSVTMSNFRDVGAHGEISGSTASRSRASSRRSSSTSSGYDHRVSGYRLEVVDSPAVVETLLDVVYPKYMVDEATASHLPVDESALSAVGHVHSRRHAGDAEVQGEQAAAGRPRLCRRTAASRR